MSEKENVLFSTMSGNKAFMYFSLSSSVANGKYFSNNNNDVGRVGGLKLIT